MLLNAPLYAYKDDALALISGDRNTTCADEFGIRPQKLTVKVLNNDNVIDCGDSKLQVIHSPGHTTGSIVLYDKDSKSLFSGDTVFADGGVGRWDLATGNFNALLKSVKKLTRLDVHALYPGHGRCCEEDGNYHIKLGLKYLTYCKNEII
jgi:glyoxylase-like metal-dependent hydrolase (beta-lactamase superfamily II)